jgi:uncharacterized protein (DUF2225 family)
MIEENAFIPKLTFLVKSETVCRLCDTKFYKESLLSGGGRLNADIVSDTLQRIYKTTPKFGRIHPLIYSIVVCPNCFFSSLPGDFENPPEDQIEKLIDQKSNRIDFANKLIGEPVDFTKFRTLKSGAAGYALAALCYDFFTRKSIPVIKQAICSIRTAYLFEDINKQEPSENYKYFTQVFYKKALFFYKRAIELNQGKEQVIEVLKFLGPDVDKNYGYDGIIYLIGILTYKFGIKTNKDARRRELDEARLYLGKLFGLGKADFEKPKEILEKSKAFHEIISKEIKELDGEI